MAGRPPYTRRPLTDPHGERTRADRDTGNHDEEILTLLNAVSKRLIASERERAALKNTLSALAARADRLEDQAQAQAEQIDRAAAVTDRIEEAIQQQARLNRRLDKMHNERVQMIRKLERIEETVIETQEALHAKALVLLTDNQVAEDSGKPRLPADTSLAAPQKAAAAATPFWHRPPVLRAAATGAVLALGVLCGWGIYTVQRDFTPAATASFTTAAAPVTIDDIPQPLAIASPLPGEAAATANALIYEPDEVLQQRFEEDPDGLAAALNAIEPSSLPPAAGPSVAEEPVAAEPADTSPVTPAPAQTAEAPPASSSASPALPAPETPSAVAPPPPPVAAPAPSRAFDDFIARVRRDTPPLAQRLKPDPALPPAVKAIETKAFAGNAEAQHDLGAVYTAGHGGVAVDYARAASLFTDAALQGVANARYNLGVLYHQGLGVTKDLPAAISWYGAAAALGHPEAQYNLGIAHIEGIGTAYDPHAAATFFETAARSGVMEAAYNLGLIHENGLLGALQPERALYWYKQAADRGSPEAQAAMDQLTKSLGLSAADVTRYIGKAASEIAPPAAAPAPLPVPAAPVKKSQVESLRPEDKIDISEIANYIPQIADHELALPVQAHPEKPLKDRALIAQIQEELVRRGLYPGPADGINGPQTEDAIRTYQMANSLPGDGRASEALLIHLLADGTDEFGSRIE